MSEYQVIARKYRPQRFCEVVGQKAILKTLVNALKLKRVGHAYLFCGTQGTGKTSIARLFAKALNCKQLSSNYEPCNACVSCKEISNSHAVDVLEIDGASHRGIEDIRKINETIGYAPTGNYKIYLIDEVHMLTKEAFNALLKSLEEPPEKVIFFFATTEPHKIPPTIISRCQRFNLERLKVEEIEQKLKEIGQELHVEMEEEALQLIARFATGSLRDAESLFEQLVTFYDHKLTKASVIEMLGLFESDVFFAFDQAIMKKDMAFAFTLANNVYSSGKNVEYFVEGLISHFRNHLLLKKGVHPKLVFEGEKARYLQVGDIYTEEGCLDVLEILTTALTQLKQAFSEKTFLEMLFLAIFRCSTKVGLPLLVSRLEELEKRLLSGVSQNETKVSPEAEKKEPKAKPKSVSKKEMAPSPLKIEEVPPLKIEPKEIIEEKALPPLEELKVTSEENPLDKQALLQKQSRYETLMRFAAKELDGSLKIKE